MNPICVLFLAKKYGWKYKFRTWFGPTGSNLVVLWRKQVFFSPLNIVLNVFFSPKNCMCKSYFVPIVHEMTAIWLVWLCAHGQTLGAPCTKSIKISSENPNFFWSLWLILAYKNEKCSEHKNAYNSYPASGVLQVDWKGLFLRMVRERKRGIHPNPLLLQKNCRCITAYL